MKSPIVKAFVLTCFVLLLSSFVAYRTGYFDKYIYNQSITEEGLPDTPTIQPDERLSSSKIMVLPKQRYVINDSNVVTKEMIDSLPTRNVKDIAPTGHMPQPFYVDGVLVTKAEYDSIKKREALPYKVNNNTQPLTVHTDSIEYEKERMRMVSSKSAYVLDPVRDSALIDAIKRRAASDKGRKTKKQK